MESIRRATPSRSATLAALASLSRMYANDDARASAAARPPSVSLSVFVFIFSFAIPSRFTSYPRAP